MGALGSLYDLRNDSDLFFHQKMSWFLCITPLSRGRSETGHGRVFVSRSLLKFYTRSHEP